MLVIGRLFRPAFVAALAVIGVGGLSGVDRPPPPYEVYAVRFATLPQFRVSALIAGADPARRLDIAMMVWVIKGGGRTILVDAGFHREDFINNWHPTGFSPSSEAIGKLGLKPDDVTDVIISHVHWDHLDGIDLFPRARVWIQREEFDYHLDSTGVVKNRAIDAGDAKLLAGIAREGRVTLVDGDDKEIIPGITVYTGGKHTFASQFVRVTTAGGAVVIASDNAYLYENLEKHRPIAQTLDSTSNLRAQTRMLNLASDPRLVVPGHDPDVFARFPKPGDGVAQIR
jgi:glyoxylase-like metal-dependent hydrolase (beta-lactamase superfamily II)